MKVPILSLLYTTTLLFALNALVYGQARLLPVTKNGSCGYLDRTGKIIIPLQFDRCWKFSEGFASVTTDGKQGFIDEKGVYLAAPQFDAYWYFTTFQEGFAPVCLRGSYEKWGFIDTAGRVTYLPEVTLLGTFHEGLAFFKKGDRAGYVNRELKIVIAPNFKSAGHFYNGRARVIDLDGSSFYIDKSGQKVFANREGSDFQNGLAFFKSNNKYGFLNTNGEIVLAPQYDFAQFFGDGLANVCVGEKWGFIDVTGQFVIPPQFDDAGEFSEGLARVAKGGKWGFIDKTGKVVIPFQFDKWTSWFEGGICEVHLNNKMGYIDKTGKYIWEPTN